MLKIAASLSLAVTLISAVPAQSTTYHKVPYPLRGLWCQVSEDGNAGHFHRCKEDDALSQETTQRLGIDSQTMSINHANKLSSCLLVSARDEETFRGPIPHGNWVPTGSFLVYWECARETGLSELKEQGCRPSEEAASVVDEAH